MLSSHWRLDPAVVFLNHGSFGACPAAVLDEQARLRSLIEAQPVRFLHRELGDRIAAALVDLARFLNADAADLAFVTNATTAVVRSLDFKSGDELLATNHGYNACNNTLRYVAAKGGAKVVIADLPFPIASADDAVRAVMAAVTDRTRLVLLDHITSPTAIILPVERLVRELAARGIDTLVDGAHAPGMLPLDLNSLGAAYYTGNCHKWLCAPKGAAFLWVRKDRQERIHPTVISHGANATLAGRTRFRVEFDWLGTHDPTPALCVPTAIRTMAALVPGGWPEIMKRNHALALEGRDILAKALNVAAPAPDSMIGSMAALRVSDAPKPLDLLGVDELQYRLLDRGIEVPVVHFPAYPTRWIRISAQLYNLPDHYRRLASALL
jgi:isopenicillin-N epimerase